MQTEVTELQHYSQTAVAACSSHCLNVNVTHDSLTPQPEFNLLSGFMS